MNRFELEKILLEEGDDPQSIFISKPIHPLDQGLVIFQEKNGLWVAEIQDRGTRRRVEESFSESDLCEAVYKRFSPKILRERNNSV